MNTAARKATAAILGILAYIAVFGLAVGNGYDWLGVTMLIGPTVCIGLYALWHMFYQMFSRK